MKEGTKSSIILTLLPGKNKRIYDVRMGVSNVKHPKQAGISDGFGNSQLIVDLLVPKTGTEIKSLLLRMHILLPLTSRYPS